MNSILPELIEPILDSCHIENYQLSTADVPSRIEHSFIAFQTVDVSSSEGETDVIVTKACQESGPCLLDGTSPQGNCLSVVVPIALALPGGRERIAHHRDGTD